MMTLALKQMALFKNLGLIDGKWVGADSGATFKITNPATGAVIVEVADMGRAETKRAIDAANRALPAWKQKTAKERSILLRKWHDLLIANADDIALLMTSEQGKPLAEAKGEVMYGASFVEWPKKVSEPMAILFPRYPMTGV
jgi:succinate-semialdehyde dehydrogenase / glutarate-semialdehyde dehydrogenase